MFRRCVQSTSLLVLIALVASVTSQTAQAGKVLRFQFKEGQKFSSATNKTTEIKRNLLVQVIRIKESQGIEFLHTVEGIDSAGIATISQKISRLRLEMPGPLLTQIKFDSANKATQLGLLTPVQPLVQALMAAEFKVKMAPTGQVVDVELPANLFQQLQGMPGANLIQGMLNVDNFKQMLTQSVMVLPAKEVNKGDTWDNSFSFDTPQGKQKMGIEYTYIGEEQVAGKALDRINFVVELDFIKAANNGLTAAPIKIKKQDSKGVVYFDNYRGQVVRSNLVQTLQVEGTVNGTRITQVVNTKVDVVVTDVK